MEKIHLADRVRNEVLRRVKEERNKLQTIHRRKVDWIGHILLRNCRLPRVNQGRIEGKDRSDGKKSKET
jgi:hypothetical protein